MPTCDTATVTVPDEGEIVVDDVVIEEESPKPGDTVGVSVGFTNTGEVENSDTFSTEVNGSSGPELDVSLQGGESVTETLEVEVPEDAEELDVVVGPESDTVTVESVSDIYVKDVTISESEATIGEEVDVLVVAENKGGSSGEESFDVTVNGSSAGGFQVTVDGGDTKEEVLAIEVPDENEFSVEVGSESDTVPTTDGSEPKEGSVEVRSVSITTPNLNPGETATVLGTFNNPGDEEASRNVDVVVNDETVAVMDVTLGASSSTTAEAEVTVPDSDTMEVQLGEETTSEEISTESSGGSGTGDVIGMVTQYIQDNPVEAAAIGGIVGIGLMSMGDDNRPYPPIRRDNGDR